MIAQYKKSNSLTCQEFFEYSFCVLLCIIFTFTISACSPVSDTTDVDNLISDSGAIAIVGADVVNPVGFSSIEDATVIVEGDVIKTIGRQQDVQIPEDAKIIDADGKWLIPGLMDLHVHFHSDGSFDGSFQGNEPKSRDFHESIRLPAPKTAVEDVFRNLLRAGVTTVRSVGEGKWAYSGKHALRERAAATPYAPRLVLSTPGFYPRSTLPSFHRITKPQQGVKRVALFNDDYEINLLKIWFVHGKFSGELDSDDLWKDHLPIVKAMLDEAKRRGMDNGVDAIEVWKAKEVMKLGGNLVHGVFFGEVDDEYISLMKENNIEQTWTLVASVRYFGAVAGHLKPTTAELMLSNPKAFAQLLDVRGLDTDNLVIPRGGSRFDGLTLTDAMQQQPYTEEIVVAVENLRRVHEAGVPVGLGTDVGITGIPYGAAHFAEFGYYRDAQFSPREILTAATINNATILNLEDEIGSLTEGKKADLVLLNADPMVDIMNASKIDGVMRNGRYFTADDLNADTPTDVVLRLRNAFNSGNAEAFGYLLMEDVAFTSAVDGTSLAGRDAVVDYYTSAADWQAFRKLLKATEDNAAVTQKEQWADGKIYTVKYKVTEKRIAAIDVVAVSDE